MVSDEVQKAFKERYRKENKVFRKSEALLNQSVPDSVDQQKSRRKTSEERQLLADKAAAQMEEVEKLWSEEYWSSFQLVLSSKLFWFVQILFSVVLIIFTAYLCGAKW